jgi:hypothetical protein
MKLSTFRKIAGLPPSEGLDSQVTSTHNPAAALTTARLKELASYCEEGQAPVVPHFSLKDEDNVKTAAVEIAKTGIRIDMEYFMGIFYFNFDSKEAHDKALLAIIKKIDTSKEDVADWGTKGTKGNEKRRMEKD